VHEDVCVSLLVLEVHTKAGEKKKVPSLDRPCTDIECDGGMSQTCITSVMLLTFPVPLSTLLCFDNSRLKYFYMET
jgi:hypothetical protein